MPTPGATSPTSRYTLKQELPDDMSLYRWFSGSSSTSFDLEKGFTASLCKGLRAKSGESTALHLSYHLIEHHIKKHFDYGNKKGSPFFSFSKRESQTFRQALHERFYLPSKHANVRVAETTIGDLKRQGCQIIASSDFPGGRDWEVIITGWTPIELFDVYKLVLNERHKYVWEKIRHRQGPTSPPYTTYQGPLPSKFDPGRKAQPMESSKALDDGEMDALSSAFLGAKLADSLVRK